MGVLTCVKFVAMSPQERSSRGMDFPVGILLRAKAKARRCRDMLLFVIAITVGDKMSAVVKTR